ncbi:MAG: hypothetical protein AAF567_26425 [Actinomycetota bacterium]
MTVLLIASNGALPKTVNVQIESDGPALLSLSGSCWSQVADTMIGISVTLEGEEVGVAEIFSNAAETHRAVPSTYMKIMLDKEWPNSHTPPTYTFTINNTNANTITDVNDNFTLALHPA